MSFAYLGSFNDASYSSLSLLDNLEGFTNLEDAKAALRERYENNGTYTCKVDRVEIDNDGEISWEREHVLFPAVTRDATIMLYSPKDLDYPLYEVSFGPRGGVNVTSC